MAFSEYFLDELTSRSDIAEVVSDYVALTRKGGNLFGLCPFHSEKTPSFSVSPDKQIYYCFGCGKGGGVISFIMEAENLPFPDAVRFLAKRAGMTVPEQEENDPASRLKERLLELNRQAARFYHEILGAPGGTAAAEYAKGRGLSGKIITNFGLGAAPDAWSGLTDAMTAKGFDREDLVRAGLALKGRNGTVYDRFRNRLMFPIINIRGEVIGFGGRVLDASQPKYLNSPDTPVFNKSKNLFALHAAKKSKQGRLILTEGYMDTLALHQAGFDCAVASLGTALTQDHARLMAHYTREVIIAYDGDQAGLAASQRAIDILGKTGLSVKVLRMQGAKDPDEYIRKFGKDAFQNLLDRSENHIEYRLIQLRTKYNLELDEEKLQYLQEAARIIAGLDSPVEREIYGARAAETAKVSSQALQMEIQRERKRRAARETRQQTRKEMAPAAKFQPKERGIRYENVRSAAAEEGVVRLISLEPSLYREETGLSAEHFSSPLLGKAFEELRRRYLEGKSTLISGLAGSFTPEETAHLTAIMQKPEALSNGGRAMEDYIDIILTEYTKRQAGENSDPLLAAREKYREKKGYGG
ncbi:DNA primase [Papillibacter cinnamivorans]|uniref:DNA primase n=1 Tax=Papillibacter cinnamivorans DSM 12816 TaxID=1122930 RepID=A0A1W1Z145_9FIRM|nr:DNA primase [Papillibacter cinnamivorans]SMC41801.1 DNA primase [Papillibacter cinnamivorans DSM 12816]